MTLRPQFNLTENWYEECSGDEEAVPVGNNAFRPIPSIQVPVLLSNHTIAMYVESPSAPPNWKLGGFLHQKISTALTVGGTPNTISGYEFKLFLKRLNLFRFPRLTNDFSLEIQVPYWLQDYHYVLFTYLGPGIADVEGKLDEIHTIITTN